MKIFRVTVLMMFVAILLPRCAQPTGVNELIKSLEALEKKLKGLKTSLGGGKKADTTNLLSDIQAGFKLKKPALKTPGAKDQKHQKLDVKVVEGLIQKLNALKQLNVDDEDDKETILEILTPTNAFKQLLPADKDEAVEILKGKESNLEKFKTMFSITEYPVFAGVINDMLLARQEKTTAQKALQADLNKIVAGEDVKELKIPTVLDLERLGDKFFESWDKTALEKIYNYLQTNIPKSGDERQAYEVLFEVVKQELKKLKDIDAAKVAGKPAAVEQLKKYVIKFMQATTLKGRQAMLSDFPMTGWTVDVLTTDDKETILGSYKIQNLEHEVNQATKNAAPGAGHQIAKLKGLIQTLKAL